MTLNKAIEHGKEKRKRHYGAKAYCYSCRNHGSCNYCKDNRLHSSRIRKESADSQLKEPPESK